MYPEVPRCLRSVIIWDICHDEKPALVLEQWFWDDMTDYPAAPLLAFAPSGSQLMHCRQYDEHVNVYSLSRTSDQARGSSHEQGEISTGHFGSILKVAWTPDSAQIAVLMDSGDVHLWDAATLSHTRALHAPSLPPKIPGAEGRASRRERDMESLSISPDGRHVLSHTSYFLTPFDQSKSTNFHDRIVTWDLTTGDCHLHYDSLGLYVAHDGDLVISCAVLRRGVRSGETDILACTADEYLWLEPLPSANEQPTAARRILADFGETVALSSDGARALCHAYECKDSFYSTSHTYSIVDTTTGVRVYDPLRTRIPLRIFVGDAFSRSQGIVVSVGGKRASDVWWFWRFQDGRLYRIPALEDMSGYSVTFTDDGTRLMIHDDKEGDVRFYFVRDLVVEEAEGWI
ncbi:uncharacterized protein BXZ73DRAFT_102180 [Epithele typhae]|uniref:uncharacterized protein n=1 Tax=Epithele typhae TaxID=378194 RepID=UPI00200835B8|nr:uncharacterized protein BXZ73DRAFT_102180 [Epithele typhae]KAH9929027.1 hypothetical protein BXZ73DRAFT_102180 [Epithele typhae]